MDHSLVNPRNGLFSSRLAASEILKQPFVQLLMSPHSDVQQVILTTPVSLNIAVVIG